MCHRSLLFLGTNNIGEDGAIAIAGALKDVPSLTSLNLQLNSISNDGAIAIAGALKDVPSLTTLFLGTTASVKTVQSQ